MTYDMRHGSYADVLDDTSADLIFTSPPYNIGSKSPRKDGRRKLGGFDPKSYGAVRGYADTIPEDDYQEQQVDFLLWAADHLVADGTLVYNHKVRRRDMRMIHPMQWLGRPEVESCLTLMEDITWSRGSTHNHCPTLLYPTTERLYVFRRVDAPYTFRNTADLPFRSDLWHVPLQSQAAVKLGHCAPMPEPIAEGVIKAFSSAGDTVCDPYAGSATTGVVASRLGRHFIGAERLKSYYEIAIQRLSDDEELEDDSVYRRCG